MTWTVLLVGFVLLLMVSSGCVGEEKAPTETTEPGIVQPTKVTPAPEEPKEGPELRLFEKQPSILVKYRYSGPRRVGATLYRYLISTGSSGEVPITVRVEGCGSETKTETFHVEEGRLYKLSIRVGWSSGISTCAWQKVKLSSPSLDSSVSLFSIKDTPTLDLITKIELSPINQITGTEDVESLIRYLKDEDYLREEAAEALGKMGEPAVEPLIQVLKHKYGQWGAADALGKIGEPAVEPLIQALNDENNDVRKNAADALGEIGDKRAVEPLIQALKEDERWSVRVAAAEALGKIKDKRAIGPLSQALKDEDTYVRKYAAEVLGETGDERAVEPLIQALKDEDSWVRMTAAEVLGKIKDKRAVEPLIQALKDKSKNVRKNAAEALGKIGDPRAVEPLIQALKDEDSSVRWKTARALGEIGDPKAVEPLKEALNDEDQWVRSEAKEALEKIKG